MLLIGRSGLVSLHFPLFFLRRPLYYTGLENAALVSFEGGSPASYTLARDYTIGLNVSLPPMSLTWVLIR